MYLYIWPFPRHYHLHKAHRVVLLIFQKNFFRLLSMFIQRRISVLTVTEEGSGSNSFPPGSPFEEFFKRFQNPDQEGDEESGNSNRRPRVQQRRSLGSGFIIDASGIIITNNHVIDGADEISIKLQDGTELEATLIGKDDKVDLAVLKVEYDEDLPFVSFGDDTKSRIGDWVLAIGNPFGIGSSVTAGIISASNRDIRSGTL